MYPFCSFLHRLECALGRLFSRTIPHRGVILMWLHTRYVGLSERKHRLRCVRKVTVEVMDTAPTGLLGTTAAEIDRPKSPWTPSYSSTSQGSLPEQSKLEIEAPDSNQLSSLSPTDHDPNTEASLVGATSTGQGPLSLREMATASQTPLYAVDSNGTDEPAEIHQERVVPLEEPRPQALASTEVSFQLESRMLF